MVKKFLCWLFDHPEYLHVIAQDGEHYYCLRCDAHWHNGSLVTDTRGQSNE